MGSPSSPVLDSLSTPHSNHRPNSHRFCSAPSCHGHWRTDRRNWSSRRWHYALKCIGRQKSELCNNCLQCKVGIFDYTIQKSKRRSQFTDCCDRTKCELWRQSCATAVCEQLWMYVITVSCCAIMYKAPATALLGDCWCARQRHVVKPPHRVRWRDGERRRVRQLNLVATASFYYTDRCQHSKLANWKAAI